MTSCAGICWPHTAFSFSRAQLSPHRKLIIPQEMIGQSSYYRHCAYHPYLQASREEHDDSLVDVIENFPHLPDTEIPVVPVLATPECAKLDAFRLRAMLRVSEPGPSGSLPPQVLYLLELGLDLEQIKMITRKYPGFAYCSLEGKIKPLIEFLLDLGVLKEDIPRILLKIPQLCGYSLSENVIPAMAFLETLGVDRKQWGKLISHSPALLSRSRTKIKEIVEFLNEFGLSKDSIVKLLIRCPNILRCSVEDNLRPTAEYFQSLGVDFSLLLRHWPAVSSFSIEAKLKPVTKFFIENGFSTEEVGIMMSRCGVIYGLSLKDNVVPKWEFFLTMGYPREDLVKFPQYFGYSLEGRIKPRYNLMKESGVKFSLNQLLAVDGKTFIFLVKKRIATLLLEESKNL